MSARSLSVRSSMAGKGYFHVSEQARIAQPALCPHPTPRVIGCFQPRLALNAIACSIVLRSANQTRKSPAKLPSAGQRFVPKRLRSPTITPTADGSDSSRSWAKASFSPPGVRIPKAVRIGCGYRLVATLPMAAATCNGVKRASLCGMVKICRRLEGDRPACRSDRRERRGEHVYLDEVTWL